MQGYFCLACDFEIEWDRSIVLFIYVNTESHDVLEYAGVDVSKLRCTVHECSSISTLEWAWNHSRWGEKFEDGTVVDQPWFCKGAAGTNKLEFLEWAREVKHCEWDEWTIHNAAAIGNLERLKYCFSNGCPCDKKDSCFQTASEGHLDCLRFLFDKVKPSRVMEKEVAIQAVGYVRINILKYLFEERKILEIVKASCVTNAAAYGRLESLKYLVEEAKVPLNDWQYIACARYEEHPECENYLLEKGCPEPSDEEYAFFVEVRLEEEREEE